MIDLTLEDLERVVAAINGETTLTLHPGYGARAVIEINHLCMDFYDIPYAIIYVVSRNKRLVTCAHEVIALELICFLLQKNNACTTLTSFAVKQFYQETLAGTISLEQLQSRCHGTVWPLQHSHVTS